jgi:hypothetical protein
MEPIALDQLNQTTGGHCPPPCCPPPCCVPVPVPVPAVSPRAAWGWSGGGGWWTAGRGPAYAPRSAHRGRWW